MKIITIHDSEIGCKLQSLLMLTEMAPSGQLSDEEIEDMFTNRLGFAGYVAPVNVTRAMQ